LTGSIEGETSDGGNDPSVLSLLRHAPCRGDLDLPQRRTARKIGIPAPRLDNNNADVQALGERFLKVWRFQKGIVENLSPSNRPGLPSSSPRFCGAGRSSTGGRLHEADWAAAQ